MIFPVTVDPQWLKPKKNTNLSTSEAVVLLIFWQVKMSGCGIEMSAMLPKIFVLTSRVGRENEPSKRDKISL